jgi:isopentenyl phosphate kinase
MEMVCRLESALIYSSQEICDMCRFSSASLTLLRADPDYPAVKARILNKTLSALDEEVATDMQAMKSRVRTMVPMALDILFTNLTSRNERVAQRAAESILDRDGRLVPVSKTTIVAETEEGRSITSTDDSIAAMLLGAQNKSGSTPGTIQ